MGELNDPDEIVTITQSIFNDRKSIVGDCDNEKLTKKVEAMIANHTCFKEEFFANEIEAFKGTAFKGAAFRPDFKARDFKGKDNGRYGFGKGRHPFNKPRPFVQSKPPAMLRKFVSPEEQVDRDFNSLVNKISNNNHNKIIEKLIQICFSSTDRSPIIVNMLLAKCYTQSHYSHLFMETIHTIYLKNKNVVRTCCEEFYAKFKSNVCHQLANINHLDQQKQYSEFCDFVSSKQQLVSHGTCIIHCINMGVIDATLHEYFDIIYDTLVENIEHDTYTDTLVMMIDKFVEMMRKCNAYEEIKWALAKLQNIPATNFSMKTKFKIQDVLATPTSVGKYSVAALKKSMAVC